MKYILFAICLFLSIFIIRWKIRNARVSGSESETKTPKKESFFKRLSDKIWKMEWEAAIPWFWICVMILLILWGFKFIHDLSSSSRAYWAERVYWAEQIEKLHQKTLTRIQPTPRASSASRQLSSSQVTLPTPARVTVEKESDSTWRVILPADQIGQTSISVEEGEKIQISATGRIKWNSHIPPTGPEGWHTSPNEGMSYPDSYFAPDIRAGALLLKISEQIFRVGQGRTITAPSDGRLTFLINDQFEHLSGNTGSFEIRVTKL